MFKAALCAVAVVAAIRIYKRVQAGDYGCKDVTVEDTFEYFYYCVKDKPGWVWQEVAIFKVSTATGICSRYNLSHETPNTSVAIVRSLFPIQCTVVKLEKEAELTSRLEEVAKLFKDRAEPELHRLLEAAVVRLKSEMSK